MSWESEAARERILALIDAEFESDAAFERELRIPDKRHEYIHTRSIDGFRRYSRTLRG